jgi:alpha-amylase/alpha-mannosidase (GH57 family)
MPLIPEPDRMEHIQRWLSIGRHLFDRRNFYGFWPPEMGFCMEMIPTLKRAGFHYVLVDSEHVEPMDAMRWEEIRYRPHIARHDGEEIIVVVRDRDLSNAQESGMDTGWFVHEIYERTKWCDFPALVTTCSDGDNGGWFRNTNMDANYWGAFYQPLMNAVRRNEAGCSPAFIHEYLHMYGAEGEVRVNRGAWNTGRHDGAGFVQWTGSQTQKDALARVNDVSMHFHRSCAKAEKKQVGAEVRKMLEEAAWHLLRAETSCNFYWGEDWVGRADADLDEAEKWIRNAEKGVGRKS